MSSFPTSCKHTGGVQDQCCASRFQNGDAANKLTMGGQSAMDRALRADIKGVDANDYRSS